MKGVTELTKRYVAAFEAFAGNGAGTAPPWLKEIRTQAIARSRSSVSRR